MKVSGPKPLSKRVASVGRLATPGRVPTLVLASHGKREEVARVLGEPEKRDLAVALAEALYRLRNPTFDNPQLRV